MGGKSSKQVEQVKAEESAEEPERERTSADIKKTRGDKEDIKRLKFEEGQEKGPIEPRSCTDIICCFIFITFLLGMFVAVGYGVYFGNPKLLLIGWDADGNGCGYSADTIDYPYLIWTQRPSLSSVGSGALSGATSLSLASMTDILSSGVCVKTCPLLPTDPIDCSITKMMTQETYQKFGKEETSSDWWKYKECEFYPDATKNIVTGTVTHGDKPFRFSTYELTGSYCMPAGDDFLGEDGLTDQFKSFFFDNVWGESASKYFGDIVKAWPVILSGVGVAVIVGYLYLWIIRCLGGMIIWISLLAIECCFVCGGLYLYYFYRFNFDVDGVEDSGYLLYTILAWVCWVIAMLFFLILCCCWGAISLGIAVFKTTAQYVQKNMKIFLMPLIVLALVLVWIAIWLVGVVFVWSVGTPMPREGMSFLTEMKWSDETRYIFIYFVFGLLWVNAWFVGMSQFATAASASLWYFECGSDSEGKGTMGRAMKWSVRYHIGSIAFGSFIIAVCQIIRLIFEYYRRKLGMADRTKKLVRVLLCITGYLLWMMEKCVKFMAKKAYIQVALTNKFFCRSAFNAFALILKHAHRFAIAAGIGWIFAMFGIITITGTTCFCGWLFLSQTTYVEVTSPWAPVIAIGIVTIVISHSMLTIFTFSSDAILQSFILDEELGFKGRSRPKYMESFAEKVKGKKGSCC